MPATKVPQGMMSAAARAEIAAMAKSADVAALLANLRASIEGALERSLLEIFDWNGLRAYIPAGSLAADGQIFYAADYPKVAAALEAGRQYTATEAQWQAGQKSRWSMGGTDATGRWYRLPKLNGGGGDRAPFLRGSIDADGGQLVGDAIRNITGGFGGSTNATRFTSPTGAFGTSGSANADNGGQLLTNQATNVDFNASRQVPTADENRPYHATITKCIRMKTFTFA